MIKPINPPSFNKITILRSLHWSGVGNWDKVVSRVQHIRRLPRSSKKIVAYPTIGKFDSYDTKGKHFSRRCRKLILGHARPDFNEIFMPKSGQEREYRYQPRISWKENPAFWD